MTIATAMDLAKEIPSKVNQLIEMGNRGYGLIKRILRMTNLNIELYEEVMEICIILGSTWKDIESVWREFEKENGGNDDVFQQLNTINEIVNKINSLAIESSSGMLTEKQNLRLLKDYLDDLTVELTMF